jgi:hypothetical protein
MDTHTLLWAFGVRVGRIRRAVRNLGSGRLAIGRAAIRHGRRVTRRPNSTPGRIALQGGANPPYAFQALGGRIPAWIVHNADPIPRAVPG